MTVVGHRTKVRRNNKQFDSEDTARIGPDMAYIATRSLSRSFGSVNILLGKVLQVFEAVCLKFLTLRLKFQQCT